MKTLDELFLQYGSTHASNCGNFAYAFEKEFPKVKGKNSIRIKLLEIGVANGGSMRSWIDYFRDWDLIFGLDIKESDGREGLIVEIGNSVDSIIAEGIEKKYGKFNIIIDDGGTTCSTKNDTFKNFFPLVEEGGVYVVCHTQHSYESKNDGGFRKEDSQIEKLKCIVDDLHFYGIGELGMPYDRGDYLKILKSNYVPTYREKWIESINFYHGICFIWKRNLKGVII